MADDREVTVERQYLAYFVADLIDVVDHDRVDALVDVDDLEMQIWDATHARTPVVPKGLLAAKDAVAPGHTDCDGGGEDGVVGIVRQDGLEVVAVPISAPPGSEGCTVRTSHGWSFPSGPEGLQSHYRSHRIQGAVRRFG